MSVQVAIRVRPFNKREQDLNTSLCVKMKGQTTTLFDSTGKDEDRNYIFDYSFWSHDGFTLKSDGMMVPESSSSPYVDQQKVFDELGNCILANAFEGYHCSLFAYGQTGSGKSYSVMGYKPNIGIVPIVCQEIFKRTVDRTDKIYEVSFGMLEIYNENAQDLLIALSKRPQSGMKIRQKPGLGFYAQGQQKMPVRNFAEIEEWMDVGNQNRSIASTQMNATSSRAHTIIMIEFKQISEKNGQKLEKLSVINLVDLAGSEKIGKTGAKGDRLKEAQNINKSLSMLGLVISTLADIQSGKQGVRVPYRDSTLTKLLANALGGNSKTIMICAISPSSDNYEESLSTLRYADQAKKIKNTAIVNEDPTEKLIRQLNEENETLKQQLEKFEKFFGKNLDPSNPNYKRFQKIQENLKENEQEIQNKQKTQEQRLNCVEHLKQQKIDDNLPHISIICEDEQLDGRMKYQLTQKETVIGNQQGIPEPDIIINSIGVRALHCKIKSNGSHLSLIPTAADFIFLNGKLVSKEEKLFHNDRLILGTDSTFVVKIPQTEQRNPYLDQKQIQYDFIVQEWNLERENEKKIKEAQHKEEIIKNLSLNADERMIKMQEVHQEKIKIIQYEMEEQKEEYEKTLNQLQIQKKGKNAMGLIKLSLLQMMNVSKIKDIFKSPDQKEINFQQKLNLSLQRITNERQKKRLISLIDQIQPTIDQMNIVASQMGRDIKFILKIREEDPENLRVLVLNKENDTQYHWDLEKALNRYYVLKETFTKNLQNPEIQSEKKQNAEGDPFFDFPDSKQIGRCSISLRPFLNFMDNPIEAWLIKHQKEEIHGILKVNVFPTDKSGINLARLDNYLKDPKELLGKTVNVKICIEEAWLTEGVKDIFCEFNIDGKNYRTQTVYQQHKNPYFCYSVVHTFEKFTQENLEYFEQQQLKFRVYGKYIHSDWESVHFAWKKEKELKWLTDPTNSLKNQDSASSLEADRAIIVGSNFLDSESSDDENYTKKKEKVKSFYNTLSSIPCLDTINRMPQVGLCFMGLLCFSLFASHAALCGLYRNHYDLYKSDSTEKRLIEETDNSTQYWLRHSVIFASSLVISSAMCVILMCYVFKVRIKELALTTMLPFVVWIISSIVWLRTDSFFQNNQFYLSKRIYDYREGKYSDICDIAMNSCLLAERFERLYMLTILCLIINIPLYIGFVRSLMIFLNQKNQLVVEQNIIKKRVMQNNLKVSESLQPLNSHQVDEDLEKFNIQRIDTVNETRK